MKKLITLLLVLAMVFSGLGAGVPTVGAAEAAGQTTVLTDIQGTKYETAVAELIQMDVISGYTDNTFKPEQQISRAEMAAIAVRTINRAKFDELRDPAFADTESHWAENVIVMAFNAEIIKGITAERFGPALPVTYAQAVTMLVRALGYTDAGLGGTWPANYLAKAEELGLTEPLGEWSADAPATRGDVALITAVKAQAIRDHWAEEEETEESGAETGAGKLADFSGRAIGLPLDVASVLNAAGDAVDEVEFLMGDQFYYLQSDDLGDVTTADFMPAGKYDGSLYAVRMNNGIVRDVQVASAANLNRYAELTADGLGAGAFRVITNNRNERLAVTGAALADFAYAADAVKCYEAVFEGNVLDTFRSVSTSAVDNGDYVRAWDLSDDYAGVAVVMVLIDKADVAAATAYGII
ncbi:MAG: S-layer homology domain-containing protein [Eubacteriales bacterium]|nr:S-layer homology domain-containing protein [Eubacteriales bacterium]